MNTLRRFHDMLFRKPAAQELARVEYEEAKRQLLQHVSSKEYHDHMADYYRGTVERLHKYLGIEGKP
jgi:hypothetical protein